ncbi:MAG: bifunctional 4-hydroxy-2-oxoglutarate aldolase/2-dehydro-3-deoxy-phosphogluconate aldolase [Chitinophagaceae bacterium]|nr:bifunctional 4-hydroxy-2-oxoglutarate aldolase/2-dehydro-3-deoxy-phosphogluconate aldolase [Chitinophagaceae bacterium]
MTKQEQISEGIISQGVLPLFFNKDEGLSLEILRVLYSAGIRMVEYTNRGEAALNNFKAMRTLADAELPGMYLGIGTIKSAEQANAFIDAGADYLISPVFDASVCDVAYLNKMLWVPGCMTPTEIHEAEKAGCPMVKLFPGNVLGPGFVSAIKELFPNLKFMPTGGVELEAENLKAWFKSGVVAVGMGSKLITKQIMENRDFELLKKNTEEALRMIKEIKG